MARPRWAFVRVVLPALLAGASLVHAQEPLAPVPAATPASAPAPNPYSLAGMKRLDCVALNDKINEGQKLGDPHAYYSAAQLVIRGVCFKYDPYAYIKLLRRAVEGDVPGSKVDLSFAYATGMVVDQDYQRAGELLFEAKALTSSGDMDPYTVGYAVAVARVVRRRSAELARHHWERPHRLLIELQVRPLVETTGTVRYLGEISPGQEKEAEEARRLVEEAVKGAIRLASWNLAKPDRARLKPMSYGKTWEIQVSPEVDKDTATLDRADNFHPY
jgi:hypothetical protein